MAKVGYVLHPQYFRHDTGPGHPERMARLKAIQEGLEVTGLQERLISLAARVASVEEIARVHDQDYVAQVASTAEGAGRFLDGDTYACPETYRAALFAAGGLLTAIDQVADGQLQSAFALVRPPGHHAEREHAMGFCLFNNVGVAAEALRLKGFKRVAIVDFDVHHGNATQHMFYDREDIFYISTHRYPFYPGTGAAEETGRGAGAGYNLNLPLGGGCGDVEYKQIFEEKLLPALRGYRPDFLLVSAGFDAHKQDPLGGMRVSAAGFAWMVTALEEIADAYCQGRSVYTLEGGYDLAGLKESVAAVFEVLLDS